MADTIEVHNSDSEEEEEKVKGLHFTLQRLTNKVIQILFENSLGGLQIYPYEKFFDFISEFKNVIKLVDKNSLSKMTFLWKMVIQWIVTIKMAYSGEARDLEEDLKFNLLLTDIMAEYITFKCNAVFDLELDDSKIEISTKHIIRSLSMIFSKNISFIQMTMLKIKILPQYHDILHPIFNKFLCDKKRPINNDIVSHLRIVLYCRQWKCLFETKEEKEKINVLVVGLSKKALRNSDSIDLVTDTILTKFIPKANNLNYSFLSVSNSVKFAMERGDCGTRTLLTTRSLNLEESIQNYFKQYERLINGVDFEICSIKNLNLEDSEGHSGSNEHQSMAISNISTDICFEKLSSANSKMNVIHRNSSSKTSLSNMNLKNCDSSRFSSSFNYKTCGKNINITSDNSPNLTIKSSSSQNNNLQYVSYTDSSSDDDDDYNSNRLRSDYINNNSLAKKINTNINNVKTTTTSVIPINSNINTNLNDNIILSDSGSDNEETNKVGFLVAKKISEQKKLLASQKCISHTKQFSEKEKNKKKSQKHRKNNKTASGSFTLHFSEPININQKSKSASSSSFAVTATSNPRDKNLNLSLESKKSIEGCTETTAVINAIINNVTCGNESNSNKGMSNSDSSNNSTNNRDIKNLQLKKKSECSKYIEDKILNQSKNEDLINGQNNDKLLFSVNLTFSSLRPSLTSSTSNSEICENNRISNSNTLYELNCIATNQPKILSGRIKNSTFATSVKSEKSEIIDEKLETETKTKFDDKEKQKNSNEVIGSQTNLKEIQIASNDKPLLEKLPKYSKKEEEFSTNLEKNSAASEKEKESKRVEDNNDNKQQNDYTKANLETTKIIEENMKEAEMIKLHTNEKTQVDLQNNIPLILNLNKEQNFREIIDIQDIILEKNVKNSKHSIKSTLNKQNSKKNTILCSEQLLEGLEELNEEDSNVLNSSEFVSETEQILHNKDVLFLKNEKIAQQNLNRDINILSSSHNEKDCNKKPEIINNTKKSSNITETVQNFSMQKKEIISKSDSDPMKFHNCFDKSIDDREIKYQNELTSIEVSKQSHETVNNIEYRNVKLNSNNYKKFDFDMQNALSKYNSNVSSIAKLGDKGNKEKELFKTQKSKSQIKCRTEPEHKRNDKEIESIVKKLMERNLAFKKSENTEIKNTERKNDTNIISNLLTLEKINTLDSEENHNKEKEDQNLNSESKNDKKVIGETKNTENNNDTKNISNLCTLEKINTLDSQENHSKEKENQNLNSESNNDKNVIKETINSENNNDTKNMFNLSTSEKINAVDSQENHSKEKENQNLNSESNNDKNVIKETINSENNNDTKNMFNLSTSEKINAVDSQENHNKEKEDQNLNSESKNDKKVIGETKNTENNNDTKNISNLCTLEKINTLDSQENHSKEKENQNLNSESNNDKNVIKETINSENNNDTKNMFNLSISEKINAVDSQENHSKEKENQNLNSESNNDKNVIKETINSENNNDTKNMFNLSTSEKINAVDSQENHSKEKENQNLNSESNNDKNVINETKNRENNNDTKNMFNLSTSEKINAVESQENHSKEEENQNLYSESNNDKNVINETKNSENNNDTKNMSNLWTSEKINAVESQENHSKEEENQNLYSESNNDKNVINETINSENNNDTKNKSNLWTPEKINAVDSQENHSKEKENQNLNSESNNDKNVIKETINSENNNDTKNMSNLWTSEKINAVESQENHSKEEENQNLYSESNNDKNVINETKNSENNNDTKNMSNLWTPEKINAVDSQENHSKQKEDQNFNSEPKNDKKNIETNIIENNNDTKNMSNLWTSEKINAVDSQENHSKEKEDQNFNSESKNDKKNIETNIIENNNDTKNMSNLWNPEKINAVDSQENHSKEKENQNLNSESNNDKNVINETKNSENNNDTKNMSNLWTPEKINAVDSQENHSKEKENQNLNSESNNDKNVINETKNSENNNDTKNVSNLWTLEKTNTLNSKEKQYQNLNLESKNDKKIISEQTNIICPINKGDAVNNFENCAKFIEQDKNKKLLTENNTKSAETLSELFSKIKDGNEEKNSKTTLNSMKINETENITKKFLDMSKDKEININKCTDILNSSQTSLIPKEIILNELWTLEKTNILGSKEKQHQNLNSESKNDKKIISEQTNIICPINKDDAVNNFENCAKFIEQDNNKNLLAENYTKFSENLSELFSKIKDGNKEKNSKTAPNSMKINETENITKKFLDISKDKEININKYTDILNSPQTSLILKKIILNESSDEIQNVSNSLINNLTSTNKDISNCVQNSANKIPQSCNISNVIEKNKDEGVQNDQNLKKNGCTIENNCIKIDSIKNENNCSVKIEKFSDKHVIENQNKEKVLIQIKENYVDMDNEKNAIECKTITEFQKLATEKIVKDSNEIVKQQSNNFEIISEKNLENTINFMTKIFNYTEKQNNNSEEEGTTKLEHLNVISLNTADSTTQDVEKSEEVQENNKCQQSLTRDQNNEKVEIKFHSIIKDNLVQDDLVSSKAKYSNVQNIINIDNNSVDSSNVNKIEYFQNIDKEIENSKSNTFLERIEILSENKNKSSLPEKTDKQIDLLNNSLKQIKLQKSNLVHESISKNNNFNTSTKILEKLPINEEESSNLEICTQIKQTLNEISVNQDSGIQRSGILQPPICQVSHFPKTDINIVNTNLDIKTEILNECEQISKNSIKMYNHQKLQNNIKTLTVQESITFENCYEIKVTNQTTSTTNKSLNKSDQEEINQSLKLNKDTNFDQKLIENGEKLETIDNLHEKNISNFDNLEHQQAKNDFLTNNFQSTRQTKLEIKLSEKEFDEKEKVIDNGLLLLSENCENHSIEIKEFNNIIIDKESKILGAKKPIEKLNKQPNKELLNCDIKTNITKTSKTLTNNTQFPTNLTKTKIKEKQKQVMNSSKKVVSGKEAEIGINYHHSNNVSLNSADSTTIESKNEKCYMYFGKDEFEIQRYKGHQNLDEEKKYEEIKIEKRFIHNEVQDATFLTPSKLKSNHIDVQSTSKHNDINKSIASNSSLIEKKTEKSKELKNNILAGKNKRFSGMMYIESSTENLFSKRNNEILKVEVSSINNYEIKECNNLGANNNYADVNDNKKVEQIKKGLKEKVNKSEISNLIFESKHDTNLNTATEILKNVSTNEKHNFKDQIQLNCDVEKNSELKKSEIEFLIVSNKPEQRSINKSFDSIKNAKNIPENLQSKGSNKNLDIKIESMVKTNEKIEENVFVFGRESENLNFSHEMVEEKIIIENSDENHKNLNISSKLFNENANTYKNIELSKNGSDNLLLNNFPSNLLEISKKKQFLQPKNMAQSGIKNSINTELHEKKINDLLEEMVEVSKVPEVEIIKDINTIYNDNEVKDNKIKEVDEYIVNSLDEKETTTIQNSLDSGNISQSPTRSENEEFRSQNIHSEHSIKKRKIEFFDKNNSFVNANSNSESSNNSDVPINNNNRITKSKTKPEIKVFSKSQTKFSNKEIGIKLSKSLEIQGNKIFEKSSKSQDINNKDNKVLNKDEKKKHSKKYSKVKKEINDEIAKSSSKSTFLKGIETHNIQNVNKSSSDLHKEKNKDNRFVNKLTDHLTSQTAKSSNKHILHEELSIYECLFQTPLKILKNEADSRSPAITGIVKINHSEKSPKTHSSNSSVKNIGEDLKEEKYFKKKERKDNTSKKSVSDKDSKSYRKENKSSSKIYKKDENIKDVLDSTLSKPIKKVKSTKEISSTVKGEVSNKTKKVSANSQDIKSNVVRKIFESQAKKDSKDYRIESEKNSNKAIIKKEKPQENEKNKNERSNESKKNQNEQLTNCTTSKQENLVLNGEILPGPTPKSAVTILTWELMNDIVERSKKTNEVSSSSCSVDSSSKTEIIDSKSSKLKKINKQSGSKPKRNNNTQQQQQQQPQQQQQQQQLQQYTTNNIIDSSDKLNELNRIDEVTSSTEVSSTTTFYVAAMNENSDLSSAENKNTPIKLRMKRLSRSMENRNTTGCGVIESSNDKMKTNCEKYPEINTKKCEKFSTERKKNRSKKRKLEKEETEPMSKKCNLNNNDNITESLEKLNNDATTKKKESICNPKLIEKQGRKSRNSCNLFEKSIMIYDVENILHKSNTKNYRGKRGRPRNEDASSISTDDNILSESEINDSKFNENFKNKTNKEYKYEKAHTEIKEKQNEHMTKDEHKFDEGNFEEKFCNKKNDSLTELIEENELKRVVETVKEFSKKMSNRIDLNVSENVNDKINVTTTTSENSNSKHSFATDKNDEVQCLGAKIIKTEKKREKKMSINSRNNVQELNENVHLKSYSNNPNHMVNDKVFTELSSNNAKILESMNCLVKVKRFSPEKLTRIVKDNNEVINYFTSNQSNESLTIIDKKPHLIQTGSSSTSNLNSVQKIDSDHRSKYSKENLSAIEEIQLFNKKLSYSRQDSDELTKVIICQPSGNTETIENVDCYSSPVSNENNQQIQTKRATDTYLNTKVIKKSLSPTISNSYSLTSDIQQQINSNSNDLTINNNGNQVNDLEYFNPYEPAFLTDFDLADVWNLIPDDKNSLIHPIPEHLRKNSDLLEKKSNLDGDTILTSIKVDREINNINSVNDSILQKSKDIIENKKLLGKDSKAFITDEKNLKRSEKYYNNDKKIDTKNSCNLSNNKQQQKIKNPLLRPPQSIHASQKKTIHNVQNTKLDNLLVNFCNPKLRSSPLKPIPTSSPAKPKNLQNCNTVVNKIKSTSSDKIVGTQLPKKIPQFNEVISKNQPINDFQSSYEHFARNAEFDELSFKPIPDKSLINTTTRKITSLSKKSDAIVTSQQIILPPTSHENMRSSNNSKTSDQKNSFLLNNNSNLNSILKRSASQTLETMPINKKPKEQQRQLNFQNKTVGTSQTTTGGTTGILIISEHLSQSSTSINNDKTSNQYYTKHTQQPSNFLTTPSYKKRVTFSGDTKK